jgi:hypothetical protein
LLVPMEKKNPRYARFTAIRKRSNMRSITSSLQRRGQPSATSAGPWRPMSATRVRIGLPQFTCREGKWVSKSGRISKFSHFPL